MLKKIIIISIVIAALSPLLAANEPVDLTESMKESLVVLEVTQVGWEQIQPWRQTSVNTVGTYGCAVGPNRILTLARPLVNAVSVQVRRYDQNEYIPAKIIVIDYEMNLCLLELDREAMTSELTPLSFFDKYNKNSELRAYWLSSAAQLTTSTATLDRADVLFNAISFARTLQYSLTNPSRSTGSGEVYCLGAEPVGLACWSSDTEARLIPAEAINRFLAEAQQEQYAGFGSVGFETSNLLDPAMRKFLAMPDGLRHGVYVSTVFTMGTGSDALKPADVILGIAGQTVNPYGRYLNDRYDRIGFEHLIEQRQVGETLTFDLWRDGREESVEVAVKDIKSDNMLVPYYEYRKRPEYKVIGGFVFQKLTRDYMTMWGDGWQGKTPPHLYQYYRDHGFRPTPERSDIVLLSYVLPTEMNLGYHSLGRLIVKSINNKEIGSIQQLEKAFSTGSESPFHVIEFELDTPAVIIPKMQLSMVDMQVQQIYGINDLSHIVTD